VGLEVRDLDGHTLMPPREWARGALQDSSPAMVACRCRHPVGVHDNR
jgi:hypothetical protein